MAAVAAMRRGAQTVTAAAAAPVSVARTRLVPAAPAPPLALAGTWERRRPPSAAHARGVSSEAASAADAGSESGRAHQRWDITPDRWVDIKHTQEDLARFPSERALFREDTRLRAEAMAAPQTQESIDSAMALRGFISCFRLGDCYTTVFEELMWERFAEQSALLERLQIPVFEDKSVVQEMHSKAVPGEGAYYRVRTQSYWLALHVWLLHTKQYALQESEGLFGSALCALLTRRMFEFQWNRIRMLLHAADVPIMSISNELQDLQEFIFGFCVALDDVFREEVGDKSAGAIARALQKTDAELSEGQYGLAPRLKYILWANVYSGSTPHDAKHLHELTVYVLRQKMMLDALPREPFFSAKFSWADHP